VGLDYSEMLLGEAASGRVSGRLVRGRAEILPFKNRSFDALFCECVFSILEDGAAALQECGRVLKEGGFLIISDLFARFGPGQEQPGANSGQLRTEGLLLKKDVLRLLTALGFSLLLWEEHGRLLREFVARLILSGGRIPGSWTCGHGMESRERARAGISYFLLIARKPIFESVEDKKNNGQGELARHG
jgi:arsenite methyltransferase